MKNKTNEFYPMTPYRRDLFLRVIDGFEPIGRVIFLWDRFTRCDEILLWCIKNRYTGKILAEFIKHTFGLRPLAAGQEILRMVDKENEIRPVLVGRDFKIN